MGLCTKIFLVNEDDSIEQLQVDQYERLLRRDPGIQLFEYAGRRIRYASVVIDLVAKQQPAIIQTQFSYLIFDADGRLDVAERGKKASLALNTLPPIYAETQDLQLINARYKFARKRYDFQYKWQPSPSLIAAIERAALGV